MILIIAPLLLIIVTWLLRMRLVNKEKNDLERLTVIDTLIKNPVDSSHQSLLEEKKQVNKRLKAYTKAKFKAVLLIIALALLAIALVIMVQLHDAGII